MKPERMGPEQFWRHLHEKGQVWHAAYPVEVVAAKITAELYKHGLQNRLPSVNVLDVGASPDPHLAKTILAFHQFGKACGLSPVELPELNITALDLLPHKGKPDGYKYVQGDIHGLPSSISPKSQQAVVMAGVVEYLRDQGKAADGAHNVLEDGGKLILLLNRQDPDVYREIVRKEAGSTLFMEDGFGDRMRSIDFVEKGSFKNLGHVKAFLKEHGFEHLSDEEIDHGKFKYWFVVAQKAASKK